MKNGSSALLTAAGRFEGGCVRVGEGVTHDTAEGPGFGLADSGV